MVLFYLNVRQGRQPPGIIKTLVEVVAPESQLLPQIRYIDVLFRIRKALELLAALLEKGMKASLVVTRVVMKCRRYLDHTMQEKLVVALRSQPYEFERLMGFEELLLVEETNSFRDVWVHGIARSQCTAASNVVG